MNENKDCVSEKESSMRSRTGVSISLMHNYDIDVLKKIQNTQTKFPNICLLKQN